jgi:hypothetical protein
MIFKRGTKVTITNAVKDLTYEEFCMEKDEYNKMLKHIGYELDEISIAGINPGYNQVVKF